MVMKHFTASIKIDFDLDVEPETKPSVLRHSSKANLLIKEEVSRDNYIILAIEEIER